MSNQGEVITKDRIGFEKSNKALGYLYKEWYELISNFSPISIALSLKSVFEFKKTSVFLMLLFI